MVERIPSALQYLEQSLQRNPVYAPAWVELASVHLTRADDGWVPSAEGYGRAREAAHRALALDRNLAGAHSAMAWIQAGYDWDWAAAEASNRKALALEPGNADALLWTGLLAATLGRADEALREIDRETDEPWRLEGLSRVYFVLDRRSDADAALALLERKYAGELPFFIAEIHALRGEDDLAFAWLDRAYAQRHGHLVDIKLSRHFQRLAGDPRYKALLRKMKLPE